MEINIYGKGLCVESVIYKDYTVSSKDLRDCGSVAVGGGDAVWDRVVWGGGGDVLGLRAGEVSLFELEGRCGWLRGKNVEFLNIKLGGI